MFRQVCNFGPKQLLLVEQAENPLFYIDRELGDSFPEVAIKALVCNITNKARVEQIFGKYHPEVVIHAAVMGQDLKTSAKLIRQSTVSSLNIAEELNIKSIAFPAFGTGVGGFPMKACAKLMITTVRTYNEKAQNILVQSRQAYFRLYQVYPVWIFLYIE